MEKENIVQREKHSSKVRIGGALFLLVLSIIGLIVSDLRTNKAWDYWMGMVPVFALVCLFLSWYLHRRPKGNIKAMLWNELLQWAGLGLAVGLIALFVHVGLMGKFDAGLAIMVLLALTTFTAGIYSEPMFIVIGLLLGIFAAAGAFFANYIYLIILPLALLGAVTLIVLGKKKRKSYFGF